MTRVRLASVGPEPARYDPLEIDLRNAEGTGPADTVLFLPNTGGKTVLLRLIFSVLHPPIVERIGSEETSRRGKNLAGYVLDRDTAHVVVEWRRAENGRFADDHVLLTGLVAEWRGGRPTSNPADLIRAWYSIRGSVNTVSMDRLVFDMPTEGEDSQPRRRIPLKRFREQLTEIAAGRKRGGPEVTITETQRDWVEHLDTLGLDRTLFRYQGAMNHNEAGASAIARFTKDLDFVGFFLETVVDPSELSVLDREFEEVAEKVRRYPEYQRRVRFEEAALSELEPLAALVEVVGTARKDAQIARRQALDLLGAFASGTAAARDREGVQRERFRERDTEARRLSGVAERLRDEWREYRRMAGAFWLDETNRSYLEAKSRTEHAELDSRAWAIAEELVRLREASAEVRVLDEAYAVEMERLRPLQESRDVAATALAARLAADAVLSVAEEKLQRDHAAMAKARSAAARTDERDALVEAARLDANRQSHEQRLGEVEAHRTRLVSLEYLAGDEPSDAARERARARALVALKRIDDISAETRSLEAERAAIDQAEQTAAQHRSQIQQHHDRAVTEVDRAQSERAELEADPLVVELAESATFDLELVGPAIAQRLHGRAAEADAGRIDLELRGNEDRRAVRGLDATGLLPPPPEVEIALTRLLDAGIVGAMTGTRYVADAVAAPLRNEIVGRCADLVGGIVVTDPGDLDRARSILRTASLDPGMIIAVGAAADITVAETMAAGRVAFVVPPAESVWDRTAAVVERQRRQERINSLDQERTALDERSKGARTLAESLGRHAVEYPAGWLVARIAARDALAAQLDRLDRERGSRDVRKREISSALEMLRDERDRVTRTAHQNQRQADELERLAEEEARTANYVGIIEALRGEAEEWRMVAVTAARTLATAEDEAADATQAASNHRAAVERIRRELSTIQLATEVAEPSVDDARLISTGGDNLSQLRISFLELDRRLSGETSNSEIAARRTVAIRARSRLHEAIDQRPQSVRERAALLIELPEAGESSGRRAATERADTEVAAARSAEREAYAVREQAQKDLGAVEEEIRTSRRTVKLSDEKLPRDRYQAARFAAAARQGAETHQSQAAAMERDRTIARDAAEAAKALAEALANLSTPLEMALNRPVGSELPAATPYDRSVEEARRTGLETARRLTDAIAAEDAAERAWRARDTALRAVLQREEFADLSGSDHLYRRLAQSPAETLARDSADLVAELRASIGILRTELDTMSGDVKLATMSLAKSVNKALSYLRLAEARSKMPKTLRDWADAPFITIRFEKPPPEQLEARLATFVAEVINRPANRPTGTVLLLQALERAVGQFSVQILKPNEAFALIRVPVAELSSQTFSNGQRSTVATALMLMLSELRRQSRGAARDASVGTLLLDNPFGNANAGFLIEVQRTVAAAAGIQLVYSTGIADFNALRHFPNVIALSNDSARRTMRRYVRANPALLEMLIPSQVGPGGRLSATRVAAASDHDGDLRG